MIECKFCTKNNFSKTLLYDFWDRIRVLNHNQFLLWNSMLILKNHKEWFTSLNQEELLKWFAHIKNIENIIKNCFNSDRFNYLQTNNSIKHFHFHIIPRYNSKITYEDISFEDKNFHGMPSVYDNYVSGEILQSIIAKIKTQNFLYTKLSNNVS